MTHKKLHRVREKAKKHNVKGEIKHSTRKDKKYMLVKSNGKKIHFGSAGMEDYLDHRDKKRKQNFRKRMRGVKTKNGKQAIKVKDSPAFLSYYLLW